MECGYGPREDKPGSNKNNVSEVVIQRGLRFDERTLLSRLSLVNDECERAHNFIAAAVCLASNIGLATADWQRGSELNLRATVQRFGSGSILEATTRGCDLERSKAFGFAKSRDLLLGGRKQVSPLCGVFAARSHDSGRDDRLF